MTTLFKRIDTVFLKVVDYDKAIEWYQNVLGFSVRWRDDNNGYAAMEIGETPLTLVRSSAEEIDRAKSHVSFNFYTPDIEAAHKHLVGHGLKVDPIGIDTDVQWFGFEDLEGNRLEVCYFPE